MPGNSGDRWAVSFTSNGATLMAAALSVAVTVSFLCLWNLVCFIGMFFGGKGTRRRYVALITLWNSNDPWFGFKEFAHYTYQFLRTKTPQDGWADILYALALCLIALAVFCGTITMGIVAPSLVQISNVAPVDPNTVFYPATPVGPVQALQDFGLRAPAVMRALGSVEAAKVTLREDVFVKADNTYPLRDDNDRVVGLDYTYNLSGVEMGLQGGSDLALEVEGFCITEYGWAVRPENEDQTAADWYDLWNDGDERTWVFLNDNDIMHAPKAAFSLHPDSPEQLVKDSNVSYAVVVHSAHRSSITIGDDPWYATEPRGEDAPVAPFEARFWVRRRRPVLSCWEQSKWNYGSHTVASVFDLKNISDIKIPAVLLEVLEATLGAGPMVVRLGNSSGDSALRSRTTSPNGVVDAQGSSMYDDMERLILASYVATRNIFTDAVMFGLHDDYDSIITGPDGQPKDGTGRFVVSSPDIQTFSLTGIVTLAAILSALILANCMASLLIDLHPGSVTNRVRNRVKNRVKTRDPEAPDGHGHNSPASGEPVDHGSSDNPEPEAQVHRDSNHNQVSGAKGNAGESIWARFHVLAAVQLFRCIYESDKDTQPPEWNCKKSAPRDEAYEFTVVPRTCDVDCMGHIKNERKKKADKKKADKKDSEETPKGTS